MASGITAAGLRLADGPPPPCAVPSGRGAQARRLAGARCAAQPLDLARHAVPVCRAWLRWVAAGLLSSGVVVEGIACQQMCCTMHAPTHGRLVVSCHQPRLARFPASYHRVATRVWEWGVTPGSIVRCWGPWGPSLTQKYCRSRFTRQQQLSEAEVKVFEVGQGGDHGDCVLGFGTFHSVPTHSSQYFMNTLSNTGLPLPHPGQERQRRVCAPAYPGALCLVSWCQQVHQECAQFAIPALLLAVPLCHMAAALHAAPIHQTLTLTPAECCRPRAPLEERMAALDVPITFI